MNKTILGLLSVFVIIGWTETALAEDYTGCVTPGGTIIHRVDQAVDLIDRNIVTLTARIHIDQRLN